MVLRRKIREEYDSILNQINQIEGALCNMPAGKLLFSYGKNSVKWYVSDGHKKVYLPKRERKVAEKLAEKKYLELKLKNLRRRREAMENFFAHYIEHVETPEETLLQNVYYQELLAPYFQGKEEIPHLWAKEKYQRNEKYQEGLIHRASSGIYVRSKSESMFELFLHTNQIPFRYECALNLDEVILYPDFTIMHPITRKIYYWEHFGLMDDAGYIQSTCAKLGLYANHGIIPSIQLITTYETKEYPLNYHDVMRVGMQYFL